MFQNIYSLPLGLNKLEFLSIGRLFSLLEYLSVRPEPIQSANVPLYSRLLVLPGSSKGFPVKKCSSFFGLNTSNEETYIIIVSRLKQWLLYRPAANVIKLLTTINFKIS
jgi:hypothetical protein